MLGVTHALKLFLAITLILSSITLTSAKPRTWKIKAAAGSDKAKLPTNAARFQAGLGPMRPRSLYSPTRVRSIPSSRPSPSLSPQSATRTIEVRSTDNTPIGFVSNTLNQKGSLGLTQNEQEKLSVNFILSSAAPFSLAIKGTTHPFLGFSGGILPPPDSLSKIYLVETEKTPPRSTPQAIGSSSNDKSESSIWSYSKDTHQLTAQWTDINGNTPSTLFWYHAEDLALGLVNSTSSNSSLGQEVLLYLV